MTGDWIILRTSGRHTMRLAESLTEDGYEAWTPVETRKIIISEKNVRRSIKLPIMPSYVFARAEHLIDLLQLAEMPVKPRRVSRKDGEELKPTHADFSVMRFHDRIPAIADGHLQSLRRIESKLTPREKAARTFAPGVSVRVKVEGGSFAGMSGRVERSSLGTTLVCFDRRMSVSISTSLLDQDELGQERSYLGMAA